MNNKIKIIERNHIDDNNAISMKVASCCIIKTINNLMIKAQIPPNIMYEIDTTIFSFGENYKDYEHSKISFIMTACQFIEQNIYKTGDKYE